MAAIVAGLGTSHSPMLSTAPELWAARLEGDRKMFEDEWEELVSARGTLLADEISATRWAQRHARVQRAIAELSASLAAVSADVLVVVGDDQEEVFPRGSLPPFAIWCGDDAVDNPPDPATLPAFRVASLWGYHDTQPTTYQCHPALARHLVKALSDDDFDVMTVAEQPPSRHLGHAFTFVQRRINGASRLPMVPVLLNTFFPESQPSVRRCHNLGAALVRAIQSWPGAERVALVASGGLSHHLVDEDLDRRLLAALASDSADDVLTIGESRFTDGTVPCGTGESKNWIVVGSAMREVCMTFEVLSYEPLYRTPAGTGVGAWFARWSGGLRR
jgi:hypothetical protein